MMTAQHPISREQVRTAVDSDRSGVFESARIERRRGPYERLFKRGFDILVAGGVLLLASPLLCLTWLGLRLTLGQGVILTQERVGRNGRPFRMLKFRTMRHDRRSTELNFDGTDRRQTHKSDEDPRHTTLGRFIRSISADELPQLLNVLKGEMSLVGPRPELYFVAKRNGILDHPRHIVRPGLTGLFQTSGLRSKVDLSEGLHLDMAYVINLSMLTDIKILFHTVGALVRRTGA